MIKPHSLFSVWTPDTVAECMEGITAAGLYEVLWDITALQTRGNPLNGEDETPDCLFKYALSKHWDELTPDQQAKLNQLATAHCGYDD